MTDNKRNPWEPSPEWEKTIYKMKNDTENLREQVSELRGLCTERSDTDREELARFRNRVYWAIYPILMGVTALCVQLVELNW